ncbi:hypothetical protein DPMN_143016 [Dreissena polymorpha]|uniref:Uncharacterized protein n=1 Tax=Dreissena polymorpha TaxID=45954 RepID=A0A9D4GFE7_DREPO|nr:hypothetical protein DPMN_143016 [Dreissena polymorpha]
MLIKHEPRVLAKLLAVRQMDTVPQFVNNSKEQIEFTNVMFPLTMPLIDQPKGSPSTNTPSDKYPGLTPVVPKYRNSLAKSLHRIYDERSLSNQSTSGASGGSNSCK